MPPNNIAPYEALYPDEDHVRKVGTVPQHMRQAVVLYIERGIGPGGFLTLLISNDLFGAFGKADDINTHAMRDWVIYFYNYAPPQCFGSPEQVKAWKESGGLYGQANAREEAAHAAGEKVDDAD